MTDRAHGGTEFGCPPHRERGSSPYNQARSLAQARNRAYGRAVCFVIKGRCCVETTIRYRHQPYMPRRLRHGAGGQRRHRQRADSLGRPGIRHVSGAAKDVAFQQCGANATDMNCRGTHDPKRPITNYVRVIDLAAPTSRHTGATNNIGPGGSTTVAPGTFFQQVTPQQADVSQPWAMPWSSTSRRGDSSRARRRTEPCKPPQGGAATTRC